jgi:hypothetical protein
VSYFSLTDAQTVAATPTLTDSDHALLLLRLANTRVRLCTRGDVLRSVVLDTTHTQMTQTCKARHPAHAHTWKESRTDSIPPLATTDNASQWVRVLTDGRHEILYFPCDKKAALLHAAEMRRHSVTHARMCGRVTHIRIL